MADVRKFPIGKARIRLIISLLLFSEVWIIKNKAFVYCGRETFKIGKFMLFQVTGKIVWTLLLINFLTFLGI